MNVFQKNKNYHLQAFLLNLTAGIFAFAWVMLTKRGLFSVAGDFNVQQIPFAMAANDAIKSGNVIWDWSLDLGSNFIGGMTFYVLGNPSFWLSLLFPSKYFIYIVGWLYILKYAFAGLTSYAWMRRYVRHQSAAVTASMLYAFSGFMATDLLFYHFHDVALLFPLMLLSVDGLMTEGRKGPLIGATFLNLLVNYFFFPGELIFLIAYFLLRYAAVDGRKAWKKLPWILTEGVLGGLLGCLLLLPAAIFTMQNPRVSFDYTGANALIFGAERYLFILKAMIFPGEVMSDQSAVIHRNFSSCAAYLPLIGMIPVIAFVKMQPKHWLTNMLKFSLICAVIPIFNAAFSLFAGLYHRWYYMPVLLFSLCAAMLIDRWITEDRTFEAPTPVQRAVRQASIIWLCISVGFVLFLVFVPWSSAETSKIYRKDVFAAWACVSIGGSIMTYLIMVHLRAMQHIILRCGIFLFAVGTTTTVLNLYHVANGEDALHLQDRLQSAAKFESDISYRFTNNDNPETLAQGIATRANFCSTVSGSIFRFYEALGLKRDVKSPDPPTGLNNLISAKFTYEKTAREDAVPIQTVKGKYYTYYIYQNEAVPPIGFTYDSYMTASEFAETGTANRCILMLKTLIIPDEAEEEVSSVLKKYDAEADGIASEEYLNRISSRHLREAAKDAERTTESYAVTIDADAEKYAFFSIPNDSGWSVTVNGKEEKIVDINGFMAVRILSGTSRIVFSYRVPGLLAGAILSLVGLAGSVIYLLFNRKSYRKA